MVRERATHPPNPAEYRCHGGSRSGIQTGLADCDPGFPIRTCSTVRHCSSNFVARSTAIESTPKSKSSRGSLCREACPRPCRHSRKRPCRHSREGGNPSAFAERVCPSTVRVTRRRPCRHFRGGGGAGIHAPSTDHQYGRPRAGGPRQRGVRPRVCPPRRAVCPARNSTAASRDHVPPPPGSVRPSRKAHRGSSAPGTPGPPRPP